MSTTETPTKNPETIVPDVRHPDSSRLNSRAGTTRTSGTPGPAGNHRPGTGSGPSGIGVASAIAAAFAVGALVWAVFAGSADTSVESSTHEQVDLNRAATLRDLAEQPTDSFEWVEFNRAVTLRDLVTQPTDAVDTSTHDEVDLNRAATLRDLATQPAE